MQGVWFSLVCPMEKSPALCYMGGGWNMLWNVDLRASRAIPGDIRTFARRLVMGSVDLLPFAERENLRNNSCLLLGWILCVCLRADVALQ